MNSLNCNGRLIDLSAPIVMGILNVTPDSFYDGNPNGNLEGWIKKAALMIEQGATFIDLGGMSSRPGAELVDPEEEIGRIVPVIKQLLREFPDILLSVDTCQASVAHHALDLGVHLINDISGGHLDPELWNVVGPYNVPYVLMHMQGTPSTMQDQPSYTDVMKDLLDYFDTRVAEAKEAGISQLIIDPGFGFGKTMEQNYQLLNQLSLFQFFDLPILVGLSRKSMIYKALGTTADHALNGTTALHMVALQQGAKILRAHDVKEAVEACKLFGLLDPARLEYGVGGYI